MRRLFGADSLRSDNATSGRHVAALRRHAHAADRLMRRLFGADSLRSDNATSGRLMQRSSDAR
jgi:hypothetical protein